eukprot:CAMPEP_0119555230 /NCGR_PEP_ID=MMETSP1352-20130426/7516_1 /TAXON_ID=265584 /ORGANISM="Stauroneis constricta, Strain CCMP1120" /LENGTH=398 /DNA_ID=CAMNT_0007601965 /DNA_START=61 /DNA_END=1257 /DNA_ORIENTATION=-
MNNRFASLALTAALALTSMSTAVVEAAPKRNKPTRAQKRIIRSKAGVAARTCRVDKKQRLRAAIIDTEACPNGEFAATVVFYDRTTVGKNAVAAPTVVATVKVGCNNEVQGPPLCGDHCDSTKDCPADSWCRFSERIGTAACTPYSDIGDTCGGYTIPGMENRCAPDAYCVPHPRSWQLPDLPGTCEKICKEDSDCGRNQWCKYQGFHPVPQPVLYGTKPAALPATTEPAAADAVTSGLVYSKPIAPVEEIRVCADYVGLDDSCGGYVPVGFQTRCPPTMGCLQEEAFLADAPGKCKLLCDSNTKCPDETICNDGYCMDECDVDDDCPNDNYWCRPTQEEGKSVCTLFANYNDDCSKAENPWEQERCADYMFCNVNKDGTGSCDWAPQVLPVETVPLN